MPRAKKKIHYLYKTTCLITGRYYVGMHSTSNLDDGYMGSGKRLRYSMRKHGVENHKKEIIAFFDTRELLVEAEKKAITPEMITDNDCMNIMSGGTGGFSSEEHKNKFLTIGVKNGRQKTNSKLKEKFGGEENWLTNFNSYVSQKAWKNKTYRESKLKNLNWVDRKHSDETKQLMSESSKGMGVGSTNSQYGTCWITRGGENKKIKKEEIDRFIQQGWFNGRTIKR